MNRLRRKTTLKKQGARWFWITLVLATVKKRDRGNPRAIAEVWRNHHLFAGSDKEAALRKANRIGAIQEGDDRGSLRLFGAPAQQEFLGVEHVAELVDGLHDGCEIGWDLRRQAIGALRRRMKLLLRRRRSQVNSRA